MVRDALSIRTTDMNSNANRDRSLSQSHPTLAADWDAERNASLTPLDVSASSRQRVWWRCPKGHEYEVSVYTRVKTGGCKICARPSHIESIRRAKLVRGRSFREARPDLLAQWDYERNVLGPDELSEKSHKLLWWRCDQGHEWQLLDYVDEGRQRNDQGFREMLAHLPAPPAGETLVDQHPEVAAEWDYERNAPLVPELFSPGSEQAAAWMCPHGHQWQAKIKNRAKNASGCPECYRVGAPHRTRQRLAAAIGSLEKARPAYLAMWDYDRNRDLSPSDLASRSGHRVWWRCPEGHHWKAVVAMRTSKEVKGHALSRRPSFLQTA